MTAGPALWMRAETRETERRAPLTPADAGRLVERGLAVTVEDSAQRVFPLGDYADAGCAVAEPGTWPTAPEGTYILGLKELPEVPSALKHRHIYFGHAYKEQPGAAELLRRFATGNGTLLDLEYLTDENGRRLAAFGYWAGYVGAALAVLHWRGRLTAPLVPGPKRAMVEALQAGSEHPKALVIGALGRCGRGAVDALEAAGISATAWDLAETRSLDRGAVLAHDILVNAVLATGPVEPFLRPADLDEPGRRLRVIADITCDVGSACNVLPIYDRTTSWRQPARRLRDGQAPLDLIAIDNLPSLLPEEASTDFSAQLAPRLAELSAPQWQRCLAAFNTAARPTHERR